MTAELDLHPLVTAKAKTTALNHVNRTKAQWYYANLTRHAMNRSAFCEKGET
jgi:hypothetical protein